jgi:chemotaxis signal transduction protein
MFQSVSRMTTPRDEPLVGAEAADPDTPRESAASEPMTSYLVFRLGSIWYGVAPTSVREVVPLQPPVIIPAAPPIVRGIVNLSGKVTVVLDLQLLLEIGRAGDVSVDSELTQRCLVLQAGSAAVGVGVDEVAGLAEVERSRVRTVPGDDKAAVVETFTQGDGERVVSVLDVSRMLGLAETRVKGGEGWRS